MIYVIPTIAAALGLTGGWTTAYDRKWGMFGAQILVLCGLGLLLWMAGRQAQGWDGIGYAIWLFLGIAPCLLGVLAGGLIGILRRRARDRRDAEAGRH